MGADAESRPKNALAKRWDVRMGRSRRTRHGRKWPTCGHHAPSGTSRLKGDDQTQYASRQTYELNTNADSITLATFRHNPLHVYLSRPLRPPSVSESLVHAGCMTVYAYRLHGRSGQIEDVITGRTAKCRYVLASRVLVRVPFSAWDHPKHPGPAPRRSSPPFFLGVLLLQFIALEHV